MSGYCIMQDRHAYNIHNSISYSQTYCITLGINVVNTRQLEKTRKDIYGSRKITYFNIEFTALRVKLYYARNFWLI